MRAGGLEAYGTPLDGIQAMLLEILTAILVSN